MNAELVCPTGSRRINPADEPSRFDTFEHGKWEKLLVILQRQGEQAVRKFYRDGKQTNLVQSDTSGTRRDQEEEELNNEMLRAIEKD